MNKIPSLGNLTPEEFVLKAIQALRIPPYKGIHSVYSRFNEVFKEYYPTINPIDITKQLAEKGTIRIRPVHGGVILYKAEDLPEAVPIESIINKIIGDLPSEEGLMPEDFVLNAIINLRKQPYKGIHSVYSRFNEAFRKYYPLLDPVKVTNKLADEGKVFVRPVRGGVMLYKAEDIPGATTVKNALKKITESDTT